MLLVWLPPYACRSPTSFLALDEEGTLVLIMNHSLVVFGAKKVNTGEPIYVGLKRKSPGCRLTFPRTSCFLYTSFPTSTIEIPCTIHSTFDIVILLLSV